MKNASRMMFSIRVTVVGMFFIATLLTAIVAIGLQYVFSRHLATDSVLSLYQHSAAATGAHLDAIEDQASQATSLLSNYPGLSNGHWVTEHAQAVFADIMQRNPVFYAIYFGFDNGDFFELVNLDSSDLVRQQIRAVPQDRWVTITVRNDGNGRRRAFNYYDENFNLRASRQEKTDYQANLRPWYIDAGSGEVSRTAPYQFQHLQAPGQTYSTRLANDNGVIAVDIALSSLNEYLQQQAFGTNSEILLYQGDGKLIASNRSAAGSAVIPASEPLVLNDKQREVLTNYERLTVSNELDWPPFDFAVSGSPYGYAIDTLTLIAEMTGLELDYVNGFRWPELVRLFERGQIDVLQPVIGTPQNRDAGELSDAFFNIDYGVVTRVEADPIANLKELAGEVVAVPKGWSIVPLVRQRFPEIALLEVETVRDVFDAVLNGNADAGLDSLATLQYTVRQFFIEDVDVYKPENIGDASLPGSLHFLLQPTQSELAEIFNQALANISDSQRAAMYAKWLGSEPAKPRNMGTVPYAELIRLASNDHSFNKLSTVTLGGREYFLFLERVGGEVRAYDYFAAMAPVSSVMAASVAKVKKAGWITGLCLLLLLPVSSWLAGFIVQPVSRLADENRKIKDRRYRELVPVNSHIVEIDELAGSLSEMARVIERHAKEQEILMESFLKLISRAIDDKSPYTARHCERVPELAMMLARRAHESSSPPFQVFHFDSDDQWREFRLGAWLHDCGKVTTPEHIIDKSTKLEAKYNRIHEIRTRFEVLWRDAIIHCLQKQQAEPEKATEFGLELEQEHQRLRGHFAFVASCNIGGESLDSTSLSRLEALSKVTWVRNFDNRLGLSPEEEQRLPEGNIELPVTEQLLVDRPEHIIPRTKDTVYPDHLRIRMTVPQHLYNMGELYNLSVTQGTLTAEDRFKINEHIISTIRMLDDMPFPEELAQVPRYASSHHETLVGTGYPRQLTAEDLSVPERIMALSDVFEALTAVDRPYKPAKRVSEAVEILHGMVLKRHIDADVFKLFLSSGVYLEFARRFLDEEQIDRVDISYYLNDNSTVKLQH